MSVTIAVSRPRIETDGIGNNGIAGQRAKLRRLLLSIFALLVLACIATYAIYEFKLQGTMVTTDDAYVGAVLAEIAPQTDGTIREVVVHETQFVRRGQILIFLDTADVDIDIEEAMRERDW